MLKALAVSASLASLPISTTSLGKSQPKFYTNPNPYPNSNPNPIPNFLFLFLFPILHFLICAPALNMVRDVLGDVLVVGVIAVLLVSVCASSAQFLQNNMF